MSLADPVTLLTEAADARRGIGAFNVIQLEHAESCIAAAESLGVPVILQISQNAVTYHGALRPLASAALAMASAASVLTVVHLDHAERPELVREAVALGIGSVMFDASKLSYEDNVAATADIVAHCHAAGVAVEAELGEVGGKDGAHAPGARTDPRQAAAFVKETGVDSLAVAVGTSHAMTSHDAVVDLDLVAALRAAVPVPLVLHGSSGLDDAGLTAAVRAGMTKINVGTRLNVAMTHAVRRVLDTDHAVVDPRRYLSAARTAMTDEATLVLRRLHITSHHE
ncbi:ketose-bisphosphate aldolase [Kibdelosporangium banguiense]|uniref:Ketose-bisphosphate aldolase n=1 Tax=Kibdelosporangium banguiense TaxID=1365924 RepID=A0ABS4TKD3_9PSEU|nr:class II fructose-bisphosphate aldolase [Kibdelosporangium banguiense]MBP2324444.1 ketose-bisphosphate aldolase [Kibdelosporangium banguiense]